MSDIMNPEDPELERLAQLLDAMEGQVWRDGLTNREPWVQDLAKRQGQVWRDGLTKREPRVQDLAKRHLGYPSGDQVAMARAVDRLALAQLRQDVDAVVEAWQVVGGSLRALASDVAMILDCRGWSVEHDPEWLACVACLDPLDDEPVGPEDMAGLVFAYCATRLGLTGYRPQDRVDFPEGPDDFDL